MPVPTYDQFIEPVLRILAQNPNGLTTREVHERAADHLNLSEADRAEVIPSGQPVYKNRCGWAHDRLKRAGFSSSPRRGIWQLTEEGRQYETTHQAPLPPSEVEKLAKAFMNVKLTDQDTDDELKLFEADTAVSDLSPEEQVHQALEVIKDQVVIDLLERLGQVSPQHFERIVLDLLHRMGYGASRADLQTTQASNDGGIDGIISLDKLGLEKVYIQAKRWQGTVGRAELQGFYGALASRRATKGVFITTSAFSRQAREFVENLEGLVLVNGRKLAQLMIEYNLGVASRAVMLPELDSDYFEE